MHFYHRSCLVSIQLYFGGCFNRFSTLSLAISIHLKYFGGIMSLGYSLQFRIKPLNVSRTFCVAGGFVYDDLLLLLLFNSRFRLLVGALY